MSRLSVLPILPIIPIGPLAASQEQSLPSRSLAVNRTRRLDSDVRRRSECRRALRLREHRALLELGHLFCGHSPISHKVIHNVIDFVAQDDPDSLPACALVSRRWKPRAAYHLKIMFRVSRLPKQLIHNIIDFVAQHDPDSLPRCALISRPWNSRATYHLKIMFYHWSPISRLPIELIHNVIDFVAQDDPDSLPTCALVSRRWNFRAAYHIEKLVVKPHRHLRITTTQELRAFLDAVEEAGYLTQFPKSLNISPDPEASSTSYIPFLDLSSRTLPNISRLILGEGLRWVDYPLWYNNGAVGSPFHSVTILDIYCRFKSPLSFFRAVRSFRNLEEVRLLHPDPFFQVQPVTASHSASHRAPAPSRVKLRKPLRSLEVPLSILPSVVEVSGDDVVNLLIRCPPPSALFWEVIDKPVIFPCSFLALETVKLTVPTESSNPTNDGLQRLEPRVIWPIHKDGISYSISLLPYCEHSTAGYRRELLNKSAMLQTIQMLSVKWVWICDTCERSFLSRQVHEDSSVTIQGHYEPTVWPHKPSESTDKFTD